MGVKITELPDGGVPDAASLIPLVKGGVTVSSPVEAVATRVAAEIFPDAALTGNPTAPTQAAANNSTRIATTAYADGAVATLSGSVSTALSAKAPLADPALTGNPTAPTQSQADDSTKIATTGYVRAAINAILDGVSADFDTLAEIATALGLKAPLADPALTGTPTAPTASLGADTTQIATTAFVQDAIDAAPSGARVWELMDADFDAEAGHAYLCDTSGGAFTATLPAAPEVGDEVSFVDYSATFDVAQLGLDPGSEKIDGSALAGALSEQRVGVQLVYSGSDNGWLIFAAYRQTESPTALRTEYLVVAGGGAGSVNVNGGGGGGGGGVRYGSVVLTQGASYTVTIGAGGTGSGGAGSPGGDSVFSSITSAGGAGGTVGSNGSSGGCGSGAPAAGVGYTGGAGNTPNVIPVQGYAGGNNTAVSPYPAGGGGGAGAAGANGTGSQSGNGGAGLESLIMGSSNYYGGGGGGASTIQTAAAGTGGTGGGTAGGGSAGTANATAATANTGGGSGGAGNDGGRTVASGGSGVVILAFPAVHPDLASVGGGLTYSVDTTSRPGYKIYIFTAGTGTFTR